MEIKYIKKPSDEQYNQISRLAGFCRLQDGLTISCPEQESGFILLYDQGILRSFLSMYIAEESRCECVGFTHPDFRRRGYFSQCLLEACAVLDEYEEKSGVEAELCFLTDHNSRDAAATLQAIEAELWYTEYIMSLPVAENTLMNIPQNKVILLTLPESHYEIIAGDHTAGTFCLYETDTYAFLYELEILENERRKGYAAAALHEILLHLQRHHIPELRLQVSDRNLPAFSLYKKTGFHITETLSYYLY